jgi:ankyrin repeat protein
VQAAYTQNLEIVELIVNVCGADIINSCDSDGCTALHQSCWESDDTEVMKFLLQSGAKVDALDTDAETALFRSIFLGRPECVKVLLAAGAAVNLRNTDGDTPLDKALAVDDDVYYSEDQVAARAEIVELLEAAGGLRAVDLPDDDDDA